MRVAMPPAPAQARGPALAEGCPGSRSRLQVRLQARRCTVLHSSVFVRQESPGARMAAGVAGPEAPRLCARAQRRGMTASHALGGMLARVRIASAVDSLRSARHKRPGTQRQRHATPSVSEPGWAGGVTAKRGATEHPVGQAWPHAERERRFIRTRAEGSRRTRGVRRESSAEDRWENFSQQPSLETTSAGALAVGVSSPRAEAGGGGEATSGE